MKNGEILGDPFLLLVLSVGPYYTAVADNRVSFLSNYCPFCSLLLLTQERYIVEVSVVVCAWVGEAVSCEDVGGSSEKT